MTEGAKTSAEEGGEGRDRIAVLDAALADQIAAGEVVERPASVVKELIENSVDAGASRVDVELEEGGRRLIRVVDDGRGIAPEELELALTRHATSKLRRPDDLIEIATLGFRGEALASICAVARVVLRSRRPGAAGGVELRSSPGEGRDALPVGMPAGTEIRVEHLFASVPARRKFLRSEATEVGHCIDAVLKTALVNPSVAFSLRHGARELLRFPAGSAADRVGQVLERRGEGPWFAIEGTADGVHVRAWCGAPSAASRQRGSTFLVVRRRVVRERSLQSIVNSLYGDSLPRGHHPVACLMVDPARGSVDVNVHPQKSEVRFSEPQRVYGAVREVLFDAWDDAPWHAPAGTEDERVAFAGGARAPASAPMVSNSTADALSRWESESSAPRAGRSYQARPGGGGGGSGGGSGGGYRLGTRALASDYGAHKSQTRAEVERLRERARAAETEPTRWGAETGLFGGHAQPDRIGGSSTSDEASLPPPPEPQLLTTLEGPTGLFEFEGKLWVVDLRKLRSFLLLHRLRRELGTDGVQAQGLLSPVTLSRTAEEVALISRRSDDLGRIGVEAEAFGDDAVIVRAVPAAMPHCVDLDAVTQLMDRIVPWLRLRDQSASASNEDADAGVAALAATPGPDPAPRLAKRWLADALATGVDVGRIPGLRVWDAAELRDGD